MTRIRARVAIFALILVLPAGMAGCGGDGGGGGEDPNEVLDQTFNNPEQISSGVLSISLDGSAEGDQSGNLTATIEGPFQSGKGDPAAFPQLDLTAQISASGAGQSFDFDGGLITTEDNAFVEYQGQAYEVGSSLFQQFTTAYEQSVRQAQTQQDNQNASSIFERLGVDPQTWLTNLSNEGDEDVEGTETIHIHGDADVEQIVSDIAKIAQRTPGGVAQALDPAQLDQVKSAIQEASLDVYSGKDDHILRRLSLSLTIEPPASAGGSSVTSVNVDLSVTLSDVNETQTISAPSSAKPISGLLSQFGLSGLGSLGSPGGTSGGGVGGGGGPSTGYLNCIQDAKTPADYNKCADELQ
ncbi:MAG: hypothetical protein AABM42_06430 [Actinomycetota bacterium]